MHNLLRCRRGTAAFATVAALVPLIGVVALGGEAGSWYVTKQHAQNAADAAAYSGGLRLACSNVASCNDTANSVDYRGKEFAAQNAFCNAGDTSYPGSQCVTTLPTGTSRAVQIDIGTYDASKSPSWTTAAGGQFVRATVSQQQRAYLAAVLGLSTVNIAAQAIAQVQKLAASPCVLALGGPITFQDNGISVNAPNCGLASNFTGPGVSIDFKNVSASNVSIGPSVAEGSCTGTAALCQKVTTYSPPVTDPYTALNAALSTLTLPACSAGPGGAPVPYTAATPCANKDYNLKGSDSFPLKGRC